MPDLSSYNFRTMSVDEAQQNCLDRRIGEHEVTIRNTRTGSCSKLQIAPKLLCA